MSTDPSALPFADFAPPVRPPSELRRSIRALTRATEAQCVGALLGPATLSPDLRLLAKATARKLVEKLRAQPARSGVQALVQEYALSSQEGVALMCLAEALLRIPDTATRDALIRDKIGGGDWHSHLGDGRSLFVNAATWGLVVTGQLTAAAADRDLGHALTRLVGRLGEPVIRRSVDIAMRMMGEQFVTGQSIDEALEHARDREAVGFTFSYDMLGEAAATARDAARYLADYIGAIHAIGRASRGRGVHLGPGISIKLSALHPRYARAQAERVMRELLPRVRDLAVLARSYDIGLNIDAEEADRLDLSLDLLESLAEEHALAGWNGLGFVVQAYNKRAPPVIDFIIDLARRTGRRIMVRLVKGAYWDSEIKRAQIEGLSDYPVYTRKAHTDVAYLACARRLLDARDAVFPQFATHNAQTLASIYHLAGQAFRLGDYEFQCLHGMGEPLYAQVVGQEGLARPCRIYAPVGTHETLLAYLVRRLLENGANSSFVHRISDPDVPVEELIADPVDQVQAMPAPGAPHDRIPRPGDLYDNRRNSSGVDLTDETTLSRLSQAFEVSATRSWSAGPDAAERPREPVRNPADPRDIVGYVIERSEAEAVAAVADAVSAAVGWAAVPVSERAACLERAADGLEAEGPELFSLIIREAGKSAANAVAEVREAVDFLRYYAAEARLTLDGARPLGPVVCISPWNFPLAIFVGQVSAALVAGNPVLAKPAEETPLIAAEAVRILHEAGVPETVVQLVTGDGRIGAALVGAPEIAAVVFTGSTEVARLIQNQLASRVAVGGGPIPLIAETGGQNAMIVDSSALAEQVVADVIQSAFDSAGQRCSALRVLCLQEEVADRTLAMLRGAISELSVGPTDRLSADVGPVISEPARRRICEHIAAMRAAGHSVFSVPLDERTRSGTFVAPTLIEIRNIAELGPEVFGPVLHVVRFPRSELDALVEAINATGYGLTFGLHSRLDSTIGRVTERIEAGNLYVNRNTIGAVVGVQPFGGSRLSGTGPKAGGPLYLARLVRQMSERETAAKTPADLAVDILAQWLRSRGETDCAESVTRMGLRAQLGRRRELRGPVGEINVYQLRPRGRVGLIAQTRTGLILQIGAALATGNQAVILSDVQPMLRAEALPPRLVSRISFSREGLNVAKELAAVLVEGGPEAVISVQTTLAERRGPIVTAHAFGVDHADMMTLDWLLDEVSISTNTAAAGGNAQLMALA